MGQIKREQGAVFDTRACAGLFLCYPWVKIHQTNVYRDVDGRLYVYPEQSNGFDMSTLSGIIDKAQSSFSWGVGF
jgi:hypothetical protein